MIANLPRQSNKGKKAGCKICYSFVLESKAQEISDDFSKPKIVWGEISDRTKFALDMSRRFCPDATTFLLVGKHIPFLAAFLNSSISEYAFSTLGTTTGVGIVRWKKYNVEQLCIPKETEEISALAEKWFALGRGDKNAMETFRSEMDQAFFYLLGLSREERDFILNFRK